MLICLYERVALNDRFYSQVVLLVTLEQSPYWLPPASEGWGRYCFHRCLWLFTLRRVPLLLPIILPLVPCPFWGGLRPSHNTSTGPMSFPGVPQLLFPGPLMGGGATIVPKRVVPPRRGLGTPGQDRMGQPPASKGWVPHQPGQDGVPPWTAENGAPLCCQERMGYLPPPPHP